MGNLVLVFGGAAHESSRHSSDGEEQLPYGDRVVDMGDVNVLDTETQAWLPCNSRCVRGGVNATFQANGFLFLSGGMHSDAGSPMPDFTVRRTIRTGLS